MNLRLPLDVENLFIFSSVSNSSMAARMLFAAAFGLKKKSLNDSFKSVVTVVGQSSGIWINCRCGSKYLG